MVRFSNILNYHYGNHHESNYIYVRLKVILLPNINFYIYMLVETLPPSEQLGGSRRAAREQKSSIVTNFIIAKI